MIDRNEWRWFGTVAHLCVGQDCRFHLATLLPTGWLVSTVGQYWPDAPIRERNARFRGIELEGKGDDRRNDYMRKIGYEEIGCGRLFETMVFRAGEPCTAEGCDCGCPRRHEAVDMDAYNSAGDAASGHMRMCEKWATITG